MKRPLVIVGPPGSAKSELAAIVANRTTSPKISADGAILETQLSKGVSPAVIDLESHAWLDRKTRVLALDRSVVVTVMPNLGHDGTRPAQGDRCSESALWANLQSVFNEAHLSVKFETVAAAQVADLVVRTWDTDPIAVAAGERSYVVEIGRGIFEERCQKLLSGDPALLFITDSNVKRLYGERVLQVLAGTGSRIVSVAFAAGEEQKHLGTLQGILEEAQRGGIDRSCPVVAFGGGVVTDVAGFAAATWMRGLRWISVPTTLLGMVDASVGGKTAVDLGEAKNAIGAFWQPSGVICDVEWLLTESVRNYSSALAEVVKTAIIGDPELFVMLEQHRDAILGRNLDVMADVVRRCVRVKARVVGLDEREQGLRAVLNLGHTLGHAVEVVGGLGARTHGEAVSLGLVAACRLGVRLGFTPNGLSERVHDLLNVLGLPVVIEAGEMRAATEIVAFDKKRKGDAIKFVFARDLGDVAIERLALSELRKLMPELAGGG